MKAFGKRGGVPAHAASVVDPTNASDSHAPSAGFLSEGLSQNALPSAGPQGPSLDQGDSGDTHSASCPGLPWSAYLPDGVPTLADVASAVAQWQQDQNSTLPSDPDGGAVFQDSTMWDGEVIGQNGTTGMSGMGDLVFSQPYFQPLSTSIKTVEQTAGSTASAAVQNALSQVGVSVPPAQAQAAVGPSVLQAIQNFVSSPHFLGVVVVLAILIPWRKS